MDFHGLVVKKGEIERERTEYKVSAKAVCVQGVIAESGTDDEFPRSSKGFILCVQGATTPTSEIQIIIL